MTRRSAARILDELAPLGIRLELEPFRALLAALGSPERDLATVLVAGTNGKGTVSALLASVARAAGLRTGLYTSPHLERWEERVRLDGDEIESAALAEALERVLAAVRDNDLEMPTPFEALTAAAFLLFRAAGVELAVLEVGLGGRLDATNAASPILAVVTRIALDHRELLGVEVAAIAREKAGIFRAGIPAVAGAQQDAAACALAEAAQRIGAPLHSAAAEATVEAAQWRGLAGHRLLLRTPVARRLLDLPLAGEHQLDNAVTAVRAAELLAARFPAIDDRAIARGLAGARWPGRLEALASPLPGVTVLLDAAHNPDGCAALTRFLARLGKSYVLVFGVLADKQVEAMLPPLGAAARAVVLTRPPSPRALAPDALAPRAPAGVPVAIVPEPTAALARAFDYAMERNAELVVVAGSIYLVGAIRGGLPSAASAG